MTRMESSKGFGHKSVVPKSIVLLCLVLLHLRYQTTEKEWKPNYKLWRGKPQQSQDRHGFLKIQVAETQQATDIHYTEQRAAPPLTKIKTSAKPGEDIHNTHSKWTKEAVYLKICISLGERNPGAHFVKPSGRFTEQCVTNVKEYSIPVLPEKCELQSHYSEWHKLSVWP